MTKKYLWVHPNFKETETASEQIDSAKGEGFDVIDTLEVVTRDDLLVLVGRGTNESDVEADDGLLMEGQSATDLLKRLQEAGLSNAPQVLSLMCAYSGQEGKLAAMLSGNSFFADTTVEAPYNGAGFVTDITRNFSRDSWGRVTTGKDDSITWGLYRKGTLSEGKRKGHYNPEEILTTKQPAKLSGISQFFQPSPGEPNRAKAAGLSATIHRF